MGDNQHLGLMSFDLLLMSRESTRLRTYWIIVQFVGLYSTLLNGGVTVCLRRLGSLAVI